MPAAIAIPALIGAGTSIAGGVMSSRAASGAAKTQAQAAQQAGNVALTAAQQVNPQIAEVAGSAGNALIDTAQNASTGVHEAVGQANNLLNPYMETGGQAQQQMAQMASTGGQMLQPEDLPMDPGYQFRLQEGLKALERSAAARGGARGGAAMKAITRYSQGVASQEYQAAFDRFRGSQNDQFNMLNTVAGRGLGAAGQAGSNLTRGAEWTGSAKVGAQQNAGGMQFEAVNRQAGNTLAAAGAYGNALTDAANARASGQIGSANAWNNALGGVANAAQGWAYQNMLTPKKPGMGNT